MNVFSQLFAHYKNYYAHGWQISKYAGVIGVVGYPLFYFLYTCVLPQPYENLGIRLIATLMCLALALQAQWPERLQRYYLGYSYVTTLYCLPFFHAFMSLKNHGNTVFLADSLMAVFFLVLLTDWRNTLVMLLVGSGLGTLLYVATTPSPSVPMEYVERLPTLLLIVLGGSLFKFSAERAEIEKQLQLRTALAGSIAHEMRNPLAQASMSLEGMNDVLSAHEDGVPAEQVPRMLRLTNKGQTAIDRGNQVIDMILSSLQTCALDPTKFELLSAAQVTQKAVDEYSFPGSHGRSAGGNLRDRVSVRVMQDFVFSGDETAYVFILFNLIKNALCYFGDRPQATLTLTVGDHQVMVKDTGPGMPEEVLLRLFESFRSVGKADGTGLGLAYCKRTMQSFGGDITCHSVLGQFTQFTLSFPAVSTKTQRLSVGQAT